jgi:hypothetical protein
MQRLSPVQCEGSALAQHALSGLFFQHNQQIACLELSEDGAAMSWHPSVVPWGVSLSAICSLNAVLSVGIAGDLHAHESGAVHGGTRQQGI